MAGEVKRPGGPGKPGRTSDHVASQRRILARTLVSRARLIYGKQTFKEVYNWVAAQDIWTHKFPVEGPPGEHVVKEAWKEITPETVDLCANLDTEAVNRTAAEERRAAIERWRETVSRWYTLERELLVERDEAREHGASGKELRALEERLAGAQRERLAAERELAQATSAIDDESFDSAALRSEVIAILARNRHHFSEDEAARVRALFAEALGGEAEHDPDVPDYLQ